MTDKNEQNPLPELNDVDPNRREALRKLVLGAAYTVPVVMSFSVDGLLVSSARAQNQTVS